MQEASFTKSRFSEAFPSPDRASEQGIGVVLSQKEEDGTDYPVALFQ